MIIGIDPGVSGALVLLDPTTYELTVTDMPVETVRGKQHVDPIGVVEAIVNLGPVELVAIEQVQGVQGSGATSAFNFGKGYGVILGALAALERPMLLVTPQRWTKEVGVGSDKGAHRQRARQLFPAHADLFARVKDDGRADAALVAWWASRTTPPTPQPNGHNPP